MNRLPINLTGAAMTASIFALPLVWRYFTSQPPERHQELLALQWKPFAAIINDPEFKDVNELVTTFRETVPRTQQTHGLIQDLVLVVLMFVGCSATLFVHWAAPPRTSTVKRCIKNQGPLQLKTKRGK
ncbi:P-type cation-transporting ATPase [Pseudohyphozyma bogoriensis]|nr:P-type cation-transporting ATPase [Pseudohyphozyma bogoriensis]